MSKIDKFQESLDADKMSAPQLNNAEQAMLILAQQLKNRNAAKTALPPRAFVDQLESRLLNEFENMQAEQTFWFSAFFKNKFSYFAYPLVAVFLGLMIYFSWGDAKTATIDTSILESELLAYEETLSDCEEELYLFSDLAYLSADFELNNLME